MCGVRTQQVVLPRTPPAPAEGARFAPRLEVAGSAGAGQRLRVRGIDDLRLNATPYLTRE